MTSRFSCATDGDVLYAAAQEELADDGTGRSAADAVLPAVAGDLCARRASAARDPAAHQRPSDPPGLSGSLCADRPAVYPARAIVLGAGRRLFAGHHQRAPAGDGAAMQHGLAMVRRPEPGPGRLGCVDLQPEPAPALRPGRPAGTVLR